MIDRFLVAGFDVGVRDGREIHRGCRRHEREEKSEGGV